MKKEQTLNEYKIKIDRLRNVDKRVGHTIYTDTFFFVDIKRGTGGGISFGAPIKKGNYRAALKKVFKQIEEELHL